MQQIHSFFIPHNPLMISKIGQEYSEKISASIDSLKKIRKKIYSINPDKIFIITPAIGGFKNIIINQSEKYLVNFQEFGDLSLEFEVEGDLDYSTRLRDFLRKNKFSVNLFSEKKVYHMSFIPLYYLNKYHTSSKGFENEIIHDINIQNEFIIIHCSDNDLKYHLKFGELLNEFLSKEDGNIIVIACGDLVKHIKSQKEQEVSEISHKIIDNIKEKQYKRIFGFEDYFKKGLYPGIKPFVSIIPLISELNLYPKILSLDREFNEVYLTVEFE